MLPSMVLFSGLRWLIPAIFFVVRPVSVMLAFAAPNVPTHQLAALSSLGIRGIGSVYYLMFAIRRNIDDGLAQQLVTFTLAAVTASIIAHGITVLPPLKWYASRNHGAAKRYAITSQCPMGRCVDVNEIATAAPCTVRPSKVAAWNEDDHYTGSSLKTKK